MIKNIFLFIIFFQLFCSFEHPSIGQFSSVQAEDLTEKPQFSVDSPNYITTMRIVYGIIWLIGSIITILSIGNTCLDLSFILFDKTTTALTVSEMVVILSFFINDLIIKQNKPKEGDPQYQANAFDVSGDLHKSQAYTYFSLAAVYMIFSLAFLVVLKFTIAESMKGPPVCSPVAGQQQIGTLGIRQYTAFITNLLGVMMRTVGLAFDEASEEGHKENAKIVAVTGTLVAASGAPLLSRMVKIIIKHFRKNAGDSANPKNRQLQDKISKFFLSYKTRIVLAAIMASYLGFFSLALLRAAVETQKNGNALKEKAENLRKNGHYRSGKRPSFIPFISSILSSLLFANLANATAIKPNTQFNIFPNYCLDDKGYFDGNCQCRKNKSCFNLQKTTRIEEDGSKEFYKVFSQITNGEVNYHGIDIDKLKKTHELVSKKTFFAIDFYNKKNLQLDSQFKPIDREMVNTFGKNLAQEFSQSFPLSDSSLLLFDEGRLHFQGQGSQNLQPLWPLQLTNKPKGSTSQGSQEFNVSRTSKRNSGTEDAAFEKVSKEIRYSYKSIETDKDLSLWDLISKRYFKKIVTLFDR